MFSSIQPLKLLQTTVLLLVQFLLCFSFIFASTSPSTAAASPLRWVTAHIAQASTDSLDVDRAAEQADAASEDIYKGLDTTKRVVGKTDKRNQVIEQAREQASEKWKSLADKAKTAQDANTDLTPTEQKTLKQVQD